MALTALKGKKLKKRAPRARSRTGVNAAPVEKGFGAVRDYFQFEVDKKDVITQQKTFVKNNFNKTDAKYILTNPESRFQYQYRGAIAFWYNTGQETTERSEESKAHLMAKLAELRESGKAIHDAKKLEARDNVVTLSPQQRIQQKISNTIMQDLLSLEDSWIAGEKASLDVYQAFGKHGLSGPATIPVRTVVEGWLLDYEDAYHKRCEQAVEGYSHLSRPELNRRIKECQNMLMDLDRIKAAKKATRKATVKKAPSLDKQVSRLKYKKEDTDYKIVSINPITIIGKHQFLAFNTKYRKLIHYVSEHENGFEFSGTSVKNYSEELSLSYTLRKPMDVLPQAMGCTPKQLALLLKQIKSVGSSHCVGRINDQTILLKVLK